METITEQGIINPEVPETPEAKLALLRLCLDAVSKGGEVHGVSPRHISHEGVQMLNRAHLRPVSRPDISL
jgi:hypothetical protein